MKRKTFLLCLILSATSAALAVAEPLHLLTYNVWGLWNEIGGKAFWRFKAIGQRLEDYDIVALQEMWDEKTEKLVQHAVPSGLVFVAKEPDLHKVGKSTGVVTLSRFPIIEQKFLYYNDCVGTDCFAKKGALFTRIELPDLSTLDIYNTHLNAFFKHVIDQGSQVRSSQIRQLGKWIRKYSPGRAYIAMGDFNADEGSKNYVEMQNEFQAEDVIRNTWPNSAEILTYDGDRNPWIGRLEHAVTGAQRLDYVWASCPQCQWIDPSLAFDDVEPQRQQHLSDHFGIRVFLSLQPTDIY